MKMALATGLVGGTTGVLNMRRSDEPEDVKSRGVHERSDLEKKLLGENPDIAPETIEAIAADFTQYVNGGELETAALGGLIGVVSDHVSVEQQGNFLGAHNLSGAVVSYAVADVMLRYYSNEDNMAIRQRLQDKHGLTEVQSIHVAKAIGEVREHYFKSYGAIGSVFGSGAHRAVHGAEYGINDLMTKPQEPGQS